MDDEIGPARPHPGSTVAAYAVAVGAAPLAWLAWVSWSDGKASDAMHVAFFVTVAVLCLVAGALARRGGWHLAALSVLAAASTVVTLFYWWGSTDSSGLFVIGIVLAAPLVAGAAPALVTLGSALASAARRPGSRAVAGQRAPGR